MADPIWMVATGGSGPLCFRCLCRVTANRGYEPQWHVRVDHDSWASWTQRASPVGVDDEGRILIGGIRAWRLEPWETIILSDPCSYCGGPANTVDHVVARGSGGRNHWTNKAPSCRACNGQKGMSSVPMFLVVSSKRRRRKVAAELKTVSGGQARQTFATLGEMARRR
jgi:hypothetical protein